jgi:hypothetical protein
MSAAGGSPASRSAGHLHEGERVMMTAQSSIPHLLDQLTRYLVHQPGCTAHYTFHPAGGRCTCGLTELLAALDRVRPAAP